MTRAKIFFVFFILLLSACDKGPKHIEEKIQYSTESNVDTVITYRFAIHPLHNPEKLFKAYQPLIDYINLQLNDVHIELEASRDYPSFEKKFRRRGPAILLPNPWQTLQAIQKGYDVIAMAGDAEDFKGVFIIRRDSNITQPGDIKGKKVSYPAPTALAAAIMPQYYLHTKGIDINHDIQNIYVGSQESSIMNVYLQKASIGATWPPPWRLFQKDHPEKAKQLRVIWKTPALINNSVMVRNDVPGNIRDEIKRIILELNRTPEGLLVLANMGTARMYSANNASYDLVQDYIDHFEQNVRPVEIK